MKTGASAGDSGGQEPIPPLSSKEQKLRQLYFTAMHLEANGGKSEALNHYKLIYEIDLSYRDVAEIVEKSYESD